MGPCQIYKLPGLLVTSWFSQAALFFSLPHNVGGHSGEVLRHDTGRCHAALVTGENLRRRHLLNLASYGSVIGLVPKISTGPRDIRASCRWACAILELEACPRAELRPTAVFSFACNLSSEICFSIFSLLLSRLSILSLLFVEPRLSKESSLVPVSPCSPKALAGLTANLPRSFWMRCARTACRRMLPRTVLPLDLSEVKAEG